ncbi:MAG: hypothetical protein JSW67_08320, partial [Candidatus Latescibacterota bacterium]
VKVVLTGDGSDEIFAGYTYYGRARSRSLRLLETSRSLLKSLATTLGATPGWLQHRSAASGYPYVMPAAFIERLLVDLPGSTLETMARLRAIERSYLAPACNRDDVLKRALCTDIGGWLPDNVLMKIDRATMAHGLEARVPFLDYRVVELAMRMPSALKWRNGSGRMVLRSAFEALIGQELAQRKKQGFALPLDAWLRNELRPLLDETLAASGLRDTPWLRRDAVGRLIGMHDAGRSDVGRALWTLYVLVGWFGEASAVSGAARRRRFLHA